jgi:hypothetical protein
MNSLNMYYSPIIIFAFNRLEPLKACVAALQKNSEAAESDLIVFVDGARENKDRESEKVEAVKDFVKSIAGFKSLVFHFSEKNKKLGPSIIAGVTEIIHQYGRAIIVEDDLIVGKNFLSFMNQGLNRYENCQDVFSVCGYTNMVKIPKNFSYDAYFCVRSSSWGWATWKDRWDSVDWELKDWRTVEKMAKGFNRWGGSDCWKMLRDWHDGKNMSWAIRFCYSQFIQNKLTLFPIISHVDNEGFDGEGTNCKKWSRFKFSFDMTDNKKFSMPSDVVQIESITKSVLSYHSIPIRIYSRLMNWLYNFHK